MTEKRLQSLKDYQGEDQIISAPELSLILGQKAEPTITVKSNIPTLDRYTEGFQSGEVYAVSGPTKMGKTLLCQSFTVEFVRQQVFPVWFSYEVPARQFLAQFDEVPFVYMPSKLKAHDMTWLEDRILEAFIKYRARVIFIDHLHYLFDIARSRNPSLDIGSVIRRLKSMAVDHGLIIFLLCHTTKGKSEGNLSYESIRDSSFVSQESDCVLMIQRTPKDGENRSQVRVEFHRRTGVMEKVVMLEKTGKYLREMIEDIRKMDQAGLKSI
ncbi:MAG: AAA family ATPase [Deltaproteobacteria bacterium]|nr:AAA family ATPase [Deltaproteobacteria bacterium]